MKIEVSEQGKLVLKEIYESIILETQEGNKLAICMRDDTFEMSMVGSDQWFRFSIDGVPYEL